MATARTLDALIQGARDDISKYLFTDAGEGEQPKCTDIDLKFKVMDLETRIKEWRRVSGAQKQA